MSTKTRPPRNICNSSTDNKPIHKYRGDNGGIHILEQSLEIAEIDAKLERLQKQLLKSSLS